ncbi:putative DNA binding domain-containing protein [Pseudogemmatithrix spongiicola]|uniref:DNA binding domain-containing protein n=1 Tax=Pseudogemmatithrix spongiicola TaxID=3062599 RepID=A0AA49JYQ4_9BACT|nr:putative DNA binding domain-containing protein [Gemmatimonadaceae bacterium 'strain 138']WKW14252.1 putative DNA binding domain-containing protein [Gemmatimonadaceae bacterium 'strain 318']
METDALVRLLAAPEGEHLECKQFGNKGDFDELCKYVAGIANSGGGVIAIGISDARPRRVVGTKAFPEPGKTVASLQRALAHSVRIDEHALDGQRVLSVTIPARPPGTAIADRGKYWYRVGEELLPMPDAVLRAIHAEVESDFSAEECVGADVSDLDEVAVAEFRQRWARQRPQLRIDGLRPDELLRDAGLLTGDGRLTNAALLLLGSHAALTRFLPQAELVYEYRATEAAGPAQDRKELRQALLLSLEQLWAAVNARNDRQSIQDGLFRQEVATFDEGVVREAILNAVAHRDYRLAPSVFVTQHLRRLEVTSPGGFPNGVTEDTILHQQVPRNRRLAETLARIGLVERAGQGVNLMFERSAQQGKRAPSFSGSDRHHVKLVLDCMVSNVALLRAIERIGQEDLLSFRTEDFIVLDRLSRGESISAELSQRLLPLRERGLVESVGRGRAVRYFLSRRLSNQIGQRGSYTRRRGLDSGAAEALLLTHLRSVGREGVAISELEQVLPGHSRSQIRASLARMLSAGTVRMLGSRRWARWAAISEDA